MSYKAKPIYLTEPANSTMKIVIDSFHRDWLQLHSVTDQLKLYHYTTLKGLKGILQTKSLWCTDTSSLNDPMELIYGRKLITNKLKEKIKIEENEKIKELLNELIYYVDVFNTILYRVFIACFCMDDNLLSQWRAYAGNGAGYNIGINFNTATKFSHDPENITTESHIILRKVIYNLEEQDEIISRSITKIIDGAKEYLSNHRRLPQAWPIQAAIEVVNILFDIIISLKNPAFKEEQEWRLIKVIDSGRLPELLQFRDINERLAPYLSTIIYENNEGNYFCPISTIKFGPMLDENITKLNLELLVKNIASSASDIKINQTDISIDSAGYVLRS